MAGAGARIWLPNIENFFASLEDDLRSAIRVSNNCDVESAQYWLAKLENTEEVLSLFYARVYETYSNRQPEPQLLGLIANLLEDVRSLRNVFGITAMRTAELEEPLDFNGLQQNRAIVQHTGEVGRPCLRSAVGESHLRFLNQDLGLRWVDIARCLGISERTLRRWRYQFGLLPNTSFTNITNEQLDQHVTNILQSTPCVGLSLTIGALRARGLNVQRERIRQSMSRVDPLSRTVNHTQVITRRVYNVRSPNSL